MKNFKAISLTMLLFIGFQAQSALITTSSDITITPSAITNIAGENANLFSVVNLGVLDPNFNPSGIFSNPVTLIGFSSTTVSNRVSETAVSNGDGTQTVTRSNLRTTENRDLLNVTINSIIDLDAFTEDRFSLFGDTAFRLDFTNLNVLDTSGIVLDIVFESELTTEVLSQETFVEQINIVPNVTVSEPSLLFVFGTFLLIMLIRFKEASKR